MVTPGKHAERAKAASLVESGLLLNKLLAGCFDLRRGVQNTSNKDNHLRTPAADPALRSRNEATDESSTLTEDYASGESHPAKAAEGRLPNGLVLNKRFVIVRFIAKGGMGEVYEAEDKLLHGTHIALKTILPEIANEPSLQMRFEHEVLAAREAVHPNLCPIYHIERCEEPVPAFLFLTMKLLPGETLAARLRRCGPLSKEEGMAVTRRMADGLAAIHAARIVHRDIKANNVMLDGSGNDLRLWITDFGLARPLKPDPDFAGKTVLAGTPGYIAPELYRGQPASRASDLFAFGVVLYEVFAGERPPEKTDDTPVTPSARLKIAGVAPVCADLIRGCLDGDPGRRCVAFDQALEALGLKRQDKKWTRRQFVTTAAVAACSITLAGWSEREPLYNLMHPLPRKRFVALLSWPKISDNHAAPMLTGVLTAIKSDLSRLEAFDRNLLVISPEDVDQDLTMATHLKDICDPLGANLALAASGGLKAGAFHLNLRLLDAATANPVREKQLTCALHEITSLPGKAVETARELLDLNTQISAGPPIVPGTQSTAAYTAFQTAEGLRKQPNDSGLSLAIEKYKDAIDLDSNFALAYARLAQAYYRLYAIKRDPGILELARRNSDRALLLEPNLPEGHLARSLVLQDTGDEKGALDEIAKVLSSDPSNPTALLWQAQIYTRLERWSDAEQTFGRALKERPNNWVIYNELGAVLHNEGKFQDAIRAFRSASASAPGSALPLINLGVEYLLTGEFAAAIESLKKGLSLAPDFYGAAVNLSLALRYQGKYEEALPYALKAVQLDPGDDTNWLELGDCLLLASPPERSQKRLQQGRERSRNPSADRSNKRTQLDASFSLLCEGGPARRRTRVNATGGIKWSFGYGFAIV